jgi:molybdopterin-guanine dinucleotide biosynthesis protein A
VDGSGFVLAGGESSRMGRDKALIKLAGETLVSHALRVLRGADLRASIAGSRSALGQFAEVVQDEASGSGPLGGVCSALASVSTEWAVFTTVDLPLIPPALIRFLIAHAGVTGRAATICSLNGFAQTFPAVVRRDALETLARDLAAGRAGCFAAFAAAGVSIVPVELAVQAGQVTDERGLAPYQWFSNINTPADLENAERILAACRAKAANSSRMWPVA